MLKAALVGGKFGLLFASTIAVYYIGVRKRRIASLFTVFTGSYFGLLLV